MSNSKVNEAKNIYMESVVARIKVLDDQIEVLYEEKEKLEELIYLIQEIEPTEQIDSKVEIPAVFETKEFEDYDKTWSWPEKVDYILKKRQSCVITADIVDLILELEPERKENGRESIRKSISGAITNHIKLENLKRYSHGGKFWIGLPEWFDGKKVKQEFKAKKPTKKEYQIVRV